jgi:serine/threonine protein phosphatase PrpC
VHGLPGDDRTGPRLHARVGGPRRAPPRTAHRRSRALGVVEPIRVEQVELELGPGETLLLYTDGLPEAGRRERHLDEQQLAAVCAAAAGAGLEEMLDQLEQGAIERAGGRMRDDIALLALRPSGTSPTPEAPTPEPV